MSARVVVMRCGRSFIHIILNVHYCSGMDYGCSECATAD